MHNDLEAAFGQLLADLCTPAVVRAIDAGGPSQDLWQEIEASGFVDALVPEAQGGAGLALSDVLPLVQASGYHGLPLPFAETMASRAVLARAGVDRPAGPLTLEALVPAMPHDERLALQAALLSGQISGAAARVLEMSIAHAQQRSQFGKPIGSFQAVQHQLSVMVEQACAARMAAQIAFASSTHLPDRTLAAMAKSVAGEAAVVLVAGSHAVHGAIGITAEFNLQLYTRRLLAWRAQAGSPSYWAKQVGQDWWDSGGTNAVDFALERLDAVRI